MKTLEEITYEAGREALSDQKSTVSEIRQRTGTLLAADALVSSFLGGTAIDAHGFRVWEWAAVAALAASLAIGAVLLAPWKLRFSVDAEDLYGMLLERPGPAHAAETPEWLVAAAGLVYRDMRAANIGRVRQISALSAALGVLMIVQTVLWLAALGLN